jgi:hypothetical protein
MNYSRLIPVFTFLFLCSLTVVAQDADFLDDFNKKRLQLNRSGMTVLGSWAVGNMAVGAVGYYNSSGSTKYFHQMNFFWNTVNLAIAGFGYYGSLEGNGLGLSLAESIQEQNSLEKILLFNAGLDIGYMATGLYLRERSFNSTKNQEMFKGYGESLILQGGFLLLFDGIMYFAQNKHQGKLMEVLENVSLSSNGIGLVYHF